MAVLNYYGCDNCDFVTATEEYGYYAIMSGLVFNFVCKDCKKVFAKHVSEFHKYGIGCPDCGGENVFTWNPVDGKCPKCGSKLSRQEGGFCLD